MIKKILFKFLFGGGEKYVHKKTGNKYTVLIVSNDTTTRDGFPEMVTYMSEGGLVYSRPMSEFVEKFEPVKKVVWGR